MSSSKNYYPQLDGLRALSVIAVVYHHWFGDLGKNFTQAGHQGAHGVTLFFVLSGFLITEILIKSKDKVSTYGLSKVLKIFYIRRTLRIFPIYYLYIGLCFLFISEVRSQIWWYITYLFNIQLYISAFDSLTPQGNWMALALQHTWTLCIEEQFYLIWPLCILLVPINRIWHLIFIVLLISLGFHFYSQYYLENSATRHHLLDAMFALICGAGLTMLKIQNIQLPYPKVALPLLFLLFIVFYFPTPEVHWLGRNLIISEGRIPIWFSIYLVYGAYTGYKGWFGELLQNKILVYIGQISYGVYLYHLIIPSLVDYSLATIGIEVPMIIKAVLYTLITLLVCQLSWMLIERPMNRLKDKFTY